jgi:hypothetical protein
MKKICFLLLPILFICMTASSLVAQDSTKTDRIRKNIVRFNLTNPAIFGDRSLIFGYERILGAHQSFSINAGQAALPKFNLISIAEDSVVELHRSSKDKGYSFTGDYRFYLASENKYRAPRGLYIGPYMSHVFMGRENTWNLNTETFQGAVTSDFKFHMTSVGAELGYQFIIWKRVALDFVLVGPSIAWYSLSAKLDTDLSAEDESALYAKIDEILTERFPGYSFVIDDIDFTTSGTADKQGFGFRYAIHLGYNF